jgi:hypothetical protein
VASDAAPVAAGAVVGIVMLPGAGARPAVAATVAIEGGTGEVRQVVTDAQGRFRVDGLAAGTYAITAVSAVGEQGDARIEVRSGGTAEATLQLVATGSSETIEVRGLSVANQRRESADAVTVVETERAKRETADLGDVLARTQGVEVRRSGGLGSSARLSLGGLTDEQIRFFLDGVPLELVGYPFGIANVPVNLVDRIEIYSGVVPIRFGADALGGGVNLVTDPTLTGTHGGLSYQTGSFGTDRLTASVRHLDRTTGLFARLDGFFDHARNDYPVDVEVPDALGRLSPAEVHLFHNAYVAGGSAVELGVVDQPWARRLAVRGFASGFDQQYQSNQAMNRVYGDVTYGERTAGTSIRYEQPLGHGIAVDAAGGYAFTRGAYRNISTCVYDWFGRCILMDRPGEADSMPHDETTWEHGAFARGNASWALAPGQSLRLSVAPTFDTRSGRDHEGSPGAPDPLSAQRDLVTVVSGLEHQLDILGDRLENIAFVKHYYQRQDSEDPQPGGMFLPSDRHTQRAGLGDGLRYRFADGLYAKLSYEWATRLPRPVELFGDNAFIIPNLTLSPESSHNVNLGLTIDHARTPIGVFGATATGFLRKVDHLIVLLGNDSNEAYQNVFGARSLGIEASGQWTSPGEYVVVESNATYQDFRNDSSDGEFGEFNGDRVPNRPYLFANGVARLQLHDLVVPHDEIALRFDTRYVHSFFRSWASVGLQDQKQTIPSQLVHTIGCSYLVRGDRVTLATTLEVSNLTDEKVFDFYGVQRPGRAFYVKTAIEY